MKKIIVLILFCFSFLWADVLSQQPFYIQSKIDRQADEISLILKGEIDETELKKIGCKIGAQFGDFTTIKIPTKNLDKLENFEQFTIYPNKPDEPLLDESTSDLMNGDNFAGCNADAAQAEGSDGSGILIGILDYYPLNWKHEDFHETSWSSDDLRVLYIWNQQDDSGTHPAGFDYGSEYNKNDLMNDNGPVINSGNHGTQCTGITAGDGSASGTGNPKMGIAPAAEIIYVHKTWDDAGTLDGIAYFQDKADELQKPIVISFSGGTYLDFPDGTDPVSIAIDSLCTNGRLAAVAGGNFYSSSVHALGTTTYENPTNDIYFEINSYEDTGSDPFDDFLDVVFYFKEGDNFNVTVISPDADSCTTTVTEGYGMFDTISGRLHISINDDASIEVVVTDEVGIISVGDIWKVSLQCPDPTYDDQGGNWSAWCYDKHIDGHFNTYNNSDMTLNIYATGQDCICVAGHNKTSGSLYSGSSAGFTSDGRIKPEISAPTYAYTATNSSSTSYASLGGTSGAAPHVAGTLALILEKNPTISPDSARTLLTDYAYTDTQTGNYGAEPNKRYGYGKLNSFRSVYPQLNPPENVDIHIIEDADSVRITWDNEGFIYKIYSSTNPESIFPGIDWNLKATVVNDGEITLTNIGDQRKFFLVTAE